MKTGIVFSKRFALHQMGEEHIESPLRIIALHELLEKRLTPGFPIIEPRPASREEIELVHLREYVDFLAETAGRDSYFPFDPDTIAGPHTFEAACLAAGAGLTAVDLILEGKLDNAFALVRPPGHHAEDHRPMGFCFFNNIAITAEYLRRRKGIKKSWWSTGISTTATAPRRLSTPPRRSFISPSTRARFSRAPGRPPRSGKRRAGL